jgi:hypothetical protein
MCVELGMPAEERWIALLEVCRKEFYLSCEGWLWSHYELTFSYF